MCIEITFHNLPKAAQKLAVALFCQAEGFEETESALKVIFKKETFDDSEVAEFATATN